MLQLLKRTFEEWRHDQVGVLAAALAYYAVFSLAPMLVVVIAVLTFLGQSDAQMAILTQVEALLGQDAAPLVRTMIESRRGTGGTVLASVVGVVLVLVGSTGVVVQLRNALNLIWNVKVAPERAGLRRTLWVRAKSLLLILGAGLLLAALLVGNAGLRFVVALAQAQAPRTSAVWTLLDPLIVVVVSGLAVAVVFKFLPNARLSWRTAAVGGSVTAVVLVLGNAVLSLYLSRGAVASAYGAAGALVAILLWVYVSAQILLLGAEFTKVYARRSGDPIEPDADAVARR